MHPRHRAGHLARPAAIVLISLPALACKSSPRSGSADAGAAVGAVGAEGGPAAGGAGSCRVYQPSPHVLESCIDYVGSDYTAVNALSVCTTNVRSGPSEYSAAACPAAARVGSCLVNGGTTVTTLLRAYPPAAATAKATCTEAGGVWTPH